MSTFASIEELKAAVGADFGYSDWIEVDQRRIDAFAEATGDRQWIHVDPERAAAGPFGTTIAHGYLSLALVPLMASGKFDVAGARMTVNYGSNKVRFPAPVPVGSRLRGRVELLAVEEMEGGARIDYRVTIEREGGQKPVCVAEPIARVYL